MLKNIERLSIVISFLILFFSSYITASSIEGKIVKIKDSVYFVTNKGNKYIITGAASICFKYAHFNIEILDPIFPTSDTITFSRYRIKNSNGKNSFSSSVRTILSAKKLRPDFEFQVMQTGKKVRFIIYIRNSSLKGERIRFPSSERYDFILMSPDEKKILWKWSWGKKFRIGFNTLIIPPSTELKFSEEWNFLNSYIEDGEYIAYGQVLCMPHGWQSKKKKVILHSETERVQLAQSFIPLNIGNKWTYIIKPGNRKFTMEVTGYLQRDGKRYYILSQFPDSTHICLKNPDSIIFRFDREQGSFVELTAKGEIHLISSDSTHRLVPSDDKFVCSAGTFDYCVDYQRLIAHKWLPLFKIVPGIGIVESRYSLPGGQNVIVTLENVLIKKGSNTAMSTSSSRSPNNSTMDNFYIIFHKYGGIPPVDIIYSIRSNGTCVTLNQGKIVKQSIINVSSLWNLIQYLQNHGIFSMRSKYGDNDIDNPLIIEIKVKIKDRKANITMKTSALDKPPMAFWEIVDKIVSTVNQTK